MRGLETRFEGEGDSTRLGRDKHMAVIPVFAVKLAASKVQVHPADSELCWLLWNTLAILWT